MLAASHAIAGAFIAAHTPQTPLLGYALAILSHPLLDLFPHWDLNSRNNGRPVLDTIIISLTDASSGFLAGFLLFGSKVPLNILFLTMFLAQLPDWLESPYHVLNWKFPPFSWIKKLQHLLHIKLAFPWGLLTQLAFLGLILSI